MEKNLIFDIGFHKGEDTKYYLEQGYKVVAVEANPMLTDYGKLKFKNYIENGQLILLNIGIANENKILDFWVNDYCSEWSSFDKEIVCRLIKITLDNGIILEARGVKKHRVEKVLMTVPKETIEPDEENKGTISGSQSSVESGKEGGSQE